jgi:hypothetical protein
MGPLTLKLPNSEKNIIGISGGFKIIELRAERQLGFLAQLPSIRPSTYDARFVTVRPSQYLLA